MRRTLPVVYSKKSSPTASLQRWGREPDQARVEISLDSDAWFAWLEQQQSFGYTYWQASGESVHFTVRPEKRGQRTYWQGWKTIQGHTIKKYIAPSASLTKAKLDTVGSWFQQQVKARTEVDQELRLYAAVVDLVWLVEQLIDQGQEPTLIERAQADLVRIKREFGN